MQAPATERAWAFTPYWAGNITHGGEVQEFQGTTYGLDFITKVLSHSSRSFRPSHERPWNLLCPAHDDAFVSKSARAYSKGYVVS